MKAQAGREGRSLSDYLLNIHKEHLGCLGNDKWDDKKEELSDHIQGKLDELNDGSFFSPKPKKGKK